MTPDQHLGLVAGLFITRRAREPLVRVPSAKVFKGRGLEGDRYVLNAGSFSKTLDAGKQLTLIESEALQALSRDYRVALEPADARRNVVTLGASLNHLVGVTFLLRTAVVRGVRLCEPCTHLERLTKLGARIGLIHRGGLRAEVLADGLVNDGDPLLAIASK